MFDLYQRFYEKSELKTMRALIDKGEEGTSFINADDAAKLAELDDFLNFFEFIAYLEKTGQLKRGKKLRIFSATRWIGSRPTAPSRDTYRNTVTRI